MNHDSVRQDDDWLFVLTERCDQCGADVGAVPVDDLADQLRESIDEWLAVLSTTHDVDVDFSPVEPREPVEVNSVRWSAAMYAAHAADVCDLFQQRVYLMITEDSPVFEFADPSLIGGHENIEAYRWASGDDMARRIEGAGERFAAIFDTLAPSLRDRDGRRSDGARFTVASAGAYVLHELVHHQWDVQSLRV